MRKESLSDVRKSQAIWRYQTMILSLLVKRGLGTYGFEKGLKDAPIE
jgi:hypothetical protein